MSSAGSSVGVLLKVARTTNVAEMITAAFGSLRCDGNCDCGKYAPMLDRMLDVVSENTVAVVSDDENPDPSNFSVASPAEFCTERTAMGTAHPFGRTRRH